MRRAAARRAALARALAAKPPQTAVELAQRLRRLATLVDNSLIALGAEPAFAEATGSPGASGLRASSLGMRGSGGRVDHAASDGSAGRFERDDRDSNWRDGFESADTADIAADHVETWRLVEKAQQGDGEAFGLLFDRYFAVVFRFIYFKINDRALAEDFTQETFFRALRRIGTITYQGRDIGAWFVTIARNIVLDHKKSARNRLETTTGDTIEAREQVPSTENAVLTTLQNEQLMAAVAQLGDEQRECVTLRFVHGMSVTETASIMGKNDGAIKALQHRAVRKLADMVDRP